MVTLPAGTTITSVAAGVAHTLALTSTGRVLGWGDNFQGELGGATVTVRPGPAGEHPAGEHDVDGTPQQIMPQARAYADAGTDEFIVRDDAGLPARQALDQIGILTQAVLPGLA